jgi:hypothetical protein
MAPRKVPTRNTRARTIRVVGRPRKVTDADIAEIVAWHAARETCAQLAKRLGLSVTTVRKVVRSHGRHYKKPPPEEDGPARIRTRVRVVRAAMLGAQRIRGQSPERDLRYEHSREGLNEPNARQCPQQDCSTQG